MLGWLENAASITVRTVMRMQLVRLPGTNAIPAAMPGWLVSLREIPTNRLSTSGAFGEWPIPRHRPLIARCQGRTLSTPMITLESYVCGRWQPGTGTPRLLYNPTTEEEMALCNSDGVEFAAVVAHARDTGGPARRESGRDKG